MERTSAFVKVWFWPRSNPFAPFNVQDPGAVVDTTEWVSEALLIPYSYQPTSFFKGTPAAYFPNTSCDMEEFLSEHNIMISLTLCMYLTFILQRVAL